MENVETKLGRRKKGERERRERGGPRKRKDEDDRLGQSPHPCRYYVGSFGALDPSRSPHARDVSRIAMGGLKGVRR